MTGSTVVLRGKDFHRRTGVWHAEVYCDAQAYLSVEQDEQKESKRTLPGPAI